MGWPGPRREIVQSRIDGDEITEIDKRAESEGLLLPRGKPNRSEMIRRLIAFGLKHMPPGWPGGQERR